MTLFYHNGKPVTLLERLKIEHDSCIRWADNAREWLEDGLIDPILVRDTVNNGRRYQKNAQLLRKAISLLEEYPEMDGQEPQQPVPTQEEST